uniref:Uncharacterized protein n=1 Tax=Steinernema glaseri TaxID=37863 RepID=A0A1I7YXU8_9BILA
MLLLEGTVLKCNAARGPLLSISAKQGSLDCPSVSSGRRTLRLPTGRLSVYRTSRHAPHQTQTYPPSVSRLSLLSASVAMSSTSSSTASYPRSSSSSGDASFSSSASRFWIPRATPKKLKASLPRVTRAEWSGLDFTECYRNYAKRCLVAEPLTRDVPLPSSS